KKEKTEVKNEEIKVDKVDIEWEFLDKRIYKIVDNSGWNFPIHVLNDSTLYFMNNFEDKTRLYKCNYFGKNEELVHDFGKEVENFKYCPSSQKFYYIDSNYLYSLEPSSKKVKMVKSSFEYVYDKYLLNKDIFEQVWSKFGSGFYDPDMHGVDWEKAKKIYGEFTKFAYRPAELSAIVNEMIGDVNASHTGYYPRRDNQAKHIQRAYGGFILDTNDFPKRGIRIKKVFQKSKLTQPYGIEAGDILLEVDGEEVGKGKSIYNTFSNKVGKKINMKFLSGGETKEIAIKGLSYRENYSMYYDNWVEERREKVEKLTDGEIGYLHIRSMNNSSYERFLEDLFAENYDKKALIIDVRNNPGGYIHDRLVEVLTKTSYAKTAPRSAGGRKYKTPGRVWEKPIVLLINENSFSDAEIFPNLFKELHLGKVIGMPTSGSVIGTGQVRFMDGSSMRMPSNGWYSLEDENMEGSGVEPDIYVEPTPKQVIEDYDVQLQRAVEELYKELN
ncbi:MAG: S41 family peptidase, partial [Candidatus Cloacimonadota bacterium]|nr:S41 family peptidase [Candidatus Cloacimonadota bacterium]